MATALTIATVDKLSLMQPEWEIVETLNGRNTFTFRILSLDGSYRPAGGAVVEFEHGSVEFNGTIHSVEEEGLGGLGVTPIISTVHCVDYNELPDRRQVEVTIPGGSTLKQALQQLVEYLSDYGVTLWGSQVDGPTFTEDVVFQMGTLTGCFDKLALMSSTLGTSYVWNIGYDKVLSMFAAGTDTAPTVADSDGFVIGDIKVTPVDMSAYANVVRVRFTSEAVSAYAFLEATGTFSDTETVTVAKTYTLQTTLTNVDGNVLIGANAAATLANLVAAITLGAGAGTTYAAAMTANPSVTAGVQSSTLMRVRALTAGAGGNAIACTETAANAAWITEGGGGVATLQFGEDEALSRSVTATTSPAAADVRERTYDHPEVLHQETAQALADGYLTRDSVLPKTTRYRTDDSAAGTHPGQTQTFVQPKRNLSSSHLITEVRITPEGSLVWYDITMVSTSTVAPAHPLEMYRHWGRGGGGSAGSAVHAGVGGGGGSSGGGPPAGTAGDVQLNIAGSFGADTGLLTYSAGLQKLGVNNIGSQAGTALAIAATVPTQAAASVAGANLALAASAATAGSATTSASAGGAVTIVGGVAAVKTSGSAAGGAVTITGGAGTRISSGSSDHGGAVSLLGGAAGAGGTGGLATVRGGAGATGGGVAITGGAATATSALGGAITILSGEAGQGGTTGAVSIRSGNCQSGNGNGPTGAITIQSGDPYSGTGLPGTVSLLVGTQVADNNATGNAGGQIVITSGTGQATSGVFSADGGPGGALGITGGVGGAANLTGNTGQTVNGGDGAAVTITGGVGGAGTGPASNTRNGGDGGNLVLGSGAGGTGTTANGVAGTVTLKAGATTAAVVEAAATVTISKALTLTPTAFASLPTGAEGMLAWVNDSNTATWGATIAAGGANKVMAAFNGTNWTVVGV
jgi:hypothetical protein